MDPIHTMQDMLTTKPGMNTAPRQSGDLGFRNFDTSIESYCSFHRHWRAKHKVRYFWRKRDKQGVVSIYHFLRNKYFLSIYFVPGTKQDIMELQMAKHALYI